MATRIRLRRDTYANWTSVNPTLAEGEIGLVTNFADNNTRIKIGDGSTAWEDLDYFTTSQDLSGYITDAELATIQPSIKRILRQIRNGRQLLDEKLSKSRKQVVSSDHTAVLDEVYHNVASATYTDPTPVEGKGFKVLVINGTATVGGTAYATAGTIIIRRYHSGSWANYANVLGTVVPVNTPAVAGMNHNKQQKRCRADK